MTKRVLIRISLIVLLLLLFWGGYELTPATGETQSITVKPGQSLREVAEVLHNKKLIKNKQIFLLYGSIRKLDSQIKQGTHEIPGSETIPRVYEELTTSPMEDGVEVTFPEGFTVEQIADRLEKNKLINRAAFVKLVQTGEGISHPLVKEIKKQKGMKYLLEGYLFPDTYSFPKKSSEKAIIEKMLTRFQQVREEIAPEDKISLNEWVTLASIVEKEAVVDKERELIAGVFHNRMEDEWRLQSCATVQYVLDKPRERLLYKDLETKSPYNTYIHEGLPPGPISNPGKQSLLASNNAKNHNYYFFVVKGDGSGEHHFSKTFKEHQKHTDHKGNW
ncbi:endolytic transglycosylase MltG [Pseudalkalibacillus berkeleyi]|uniref:Endolytic murein transglycosylase n=1 Tax=Pseudalkalibacillus berkeleyi TaxID=1069813 RepID=A0ABS9H2X5_9BACL|nr:endolytic transglycosylase MltG [Pseudalkalibacillus berkeleyi]MCF6138315.1 endolytic transglycosylase MltG [Pseudalkalibacillus berkeleyi]